MIMGQVLVSKQGEYLSFPPTLPGWEHNDDAPINVKPYPLPQYGEGGDLT